MTTRALHRFSRRDLLAAAFGMAVTPALAQNLERRVEVLLGERGATRSFEDGISEYEAVVYALSLREGQACRIALASSNAANCFDVFAPGEPKPVFSGGESGNEHTLVARTAGDYLVRVFLLRFAARDGQAARFTLELTRTA
jgi:hypothetical protein